MNNWKKESSNMRLAKIYSIDLKIFYGDEKYFNNLIDKKIFNRHKKIYKKVEEDNKVNFVDAKLEYEKTK